MHIFCPSEKIQSSENNQQSCRIPFFGYRDAHTDAFRRDETAIVSFPGVHGYAWEKLTEVSCEVVFSFRMKKLLGMGSMIRKQTEAASVWTFI
eukprot:Skav227366  [mRNA]  locus=scaffold2373:83649:83927:+ [translate_table: standard]